MRLALAVVLTAVPAFVCLAWWLDDLEHGRRADNLRAQVVARMENGGRERCLAAPTTFGGVQRMQRIERRRPAARGRGVSVSRRYNNARNNAAAARRSGMQIAIWTYRADFTSANPGAPPFPAALRAAVEQDAPASTVEQRGNETRLLVSMRLDADDSPCAIALGIQSAPAAQAPAWRGALSAGLVLGVALLAMLIAIGPVVARIRSLTEQVRRSAAERYARPVTVSGRDEVALLAAAFNDAGAEVRAHIDQLAEREQTLREFLGDTTHDVMLPLTVLQGHLMTLRTAVDQNRVPDANVLRAALDEAHYMASLVHNLGATAKLDAGDSHVHRERVDLAALVERVVARHRPIAALRRIGVEFATPHPPPHARGDVTLLEQAVSNLVHNAVRYNHEGGHVAVVLATDDNGFSLRVTDDGPGMPPDEFDRLAERNYRGSEARSRHPEGRGLGLHIAQAVAMRHGMQLQLRASEYGGLEVELRGSLAADADR